MATNANVDPNAITIRDTVGTMRDTTTDDAHLDDVRRIRIDIMEEMNSAFWRSVFGEFLATLMFLYITMSTVMFRNNTCNIIDAAWAFGGSIILLVYSFAGVSGANINPAVSFGLLLCNKLTFVRFFFYVVGQMAGACVGSAFALALQPETTATPWNEVYSIPAGRAVWAEIMGTFCLVWVVMAACDNNRCGKVPHLGPLAPIAIGITVFVLHLGMIGIDNCSINPARSFGAAVVFGSWKDHWVFWVGPMIGGGSAGIIYELIFKDTAKTERATLIKL